MPRRRSAAGFLHIPRSNQVITRKVLLHIMHRYSRPFCASSPGTYWSRSTGRVQPSTWSPRPCASWRSRFQMLAARATCVVFLQESHLSGTLHQANDSAGCSGKPLSKSSRTGPTPVQCWLSWMHSQPFSLAGADCFGRTSPGSSDCRICLVLRQRNPRTQERIARAT